MVNPRSGVVVIAWHRRDEALACVQRLVELPDRPPATPRHGRGAAGGVG